mgnify:CR=1 FL=1
MSSGVDVEPMEDDSVNQVEEGKEIGYGSYHFDENGSYLDHSLNFACQDAKFDNSDELVPT